MHCHLLVPDLFWPARDAPDIYRELRIPALAQLLAKGRRRHGEAKSAEAWLSQAFRLERQQDWPVAPFSLLADGGEPGAHHWLRADPVHLKLEGNRLLLADSGVFSITQQEAEHLGASLNAHFAADGLTFCPLRPDRWYLRVEPAPALETTALAEAAGRSVDDLLPRGADASTWRARLNEVQMLLHGHAINDARERAGQMAINSVWLWGGGRLAGAVSAPYAAVWSKDAFAAGLAQAARAAGPAQATHPAEPAQATHPAARDLPDGAAEFLRAATSEGVNLIVLDALHRAAQYGDAQGWREHLARLDRDWFAPFVQALRQERIGMLSLHAPGREGTLSVEITRGDLRRFWRRAKPLADFAWP